MQVKLGINTLWVGGKRSVLLLGGRERGIVLILNQETIKGLNWVLNLFPAWEDAIWRPCLTPHSFGTPRVNHIPSFSYTHMRKSPNSPAGKRLRKQWQRNLFQLATLNYSLQNRWTRTYFAGSQMKCSLPLMAFGGNPWITMNYHEVQIDIQQECWRSNSTGKWQYVGVPWMSLDICLLWLWDIPTGCIELKYNTRLGQTYSHPVQM